MKNIFKVYTFSHRILAKTSQKCKTHLNDMQPNNPPWKITHNKTRRPTKVCRLQEVDGDSEQIFCVYLTYSSLLLDCLGIYMEQWKANDKEGCKGQSPARSDGPGKPWSGERKRSTGNKRSQVWPWGSRVSPR